MGVFENLPYANFHELNLDWIIKMMRQTADYLEKLQTQVDDLDIEAADSLLQQVRSELTATTAKVNNLVPKVQTHDSGWTAAEAKGIMDSSYTVVDEFAIEETGYYLIENQVTYSMDNAAYNDLAIISTFIRFESAEGAGLGHTMRESTPLNGSVHGGSSLANTLYLNAGSKVIISAAQIPVSSNDTFLVACEHCVTKAFRLCKSLS